MEAFNRRFEEVLDYPAMAPVKVRYHTFLSLPQKKKSRLAVIASILCFFFFFIILIVVLGTTTKEVTKAKTAVVVFMEATPDDLLAMRYLMMRPDYHVAAVVLSGTGIATALRPSSENVEKFLSLMATEGNKAAANVPIFYGTSFSTSQTQRVSTAAVSGTLPTTPLSAAAAYLNNLSSVIGAPSDPMSCSMTSRFVEDDVLYRGDTLYGARMYLPRRAAGVRGYVDRTDTFSYAAAQSAIAAQKGRWGQDPRSSEPFFIPLAKNVLLPLQQRGVPIRAICLGPTTDLVTLLRRSYKTDPKTSPMPQFPIPKIFNDIIVAGGAFGSSAVGDVDTYVSTLLGPNGPINVHAQANFFFDAPSAHTLVEGGTDFNDAFATAMAPILTLVTTNAADTARFTQSSWNTIVDARASALTVERPTAVGVALKGLSNIRRMASSQPPLFTMDLSAPLGLLAAVVLTDAVSTVKSSVSDRVHVNDANQVAYEGVTGKGTRMTSPVRSVVLGASATNFWLTAQNFLFHMPNPKDV